MPSSVSRRRLLEDAAAAAAVTVLFDGLPLAAALQDSSPPGVPDGASREPQKSPPAEPSNRGNASADGEPWPGYPRQDAALVREIVGAAHRDEVRVRTLLDLRPGLANAWWDWGFGDWESPLGAAAHTGRRSIAELLIERGARIDIFAAAMLGYTDVVKALVAAAPGVQRTPGPHGIPLLAHARAGGPKAQATATWLESLGDASQTPQSREVTAEQAQAYVGRYRFGGAEAAFDVKFEREQLSIVRSPEAPRRLVCTAEHQFFPAGAPSVSIQFEMREERSAAMVVSERDFELRAVRME